MGSVSSPPGDKAARAQWLSTLARADASRLQSLAQPWIDGMPFEWLRRPQVGLYLAQGRMDGEGDRFNLADVTVTRCAVRSNHQTVGIGYVMGRNPDKARSMACIDALLQVDSQRTAMLDAVISPLLHEHEQTRRKESDQASRSRVQFYTLAPDTSAKPINADR